MLGNDSDDFPLDGGKARLAKLFESSPPDNVSLKYTAPREPKMRTMPGRSPTSLVHLKVLIGKTVEAFKMENGKYVSYGKVGAAILGSEEKCHFQLYIYRNDERKVTSADIDPGFQFTVHAHNYAMFHNRHAEGWSLHFEKPSDLSDFCKEVALSKWRSFDGSSPQVVQDNVYGDSGRCIEAGDTVVALYKVFPLGEDNKLGKELPKRTLSSAANSSMWEVNIIGAFLGSSRIIILPQRHLGDWEGVVPPGSNVFLEMEIQQINSQQPKKLDHPGFSSQNVPSKKHTKIVEGTSPKSKLISRISKMGQPLLPFPNFPCKESDSESESNETDATSMESLRSIGSSGNKSRDRQSTCAIVANMVHHDGGVQPEQITMFKQNSHCLGKEPMSHGFTQDCTINAQFNVLFSEMRTSNAEIRMNLTRLSDKVDSIGHKVDCNGESFYNKLNHASNRLDYLVNMYEELKSSLNLKLSEISEQNQALWSFLKEKNSFGHTDNTDELRVQVLNLEKKNHELEEYLSNAKSTSNALQVKVQELKDHISTVEKQKEVLQKAEESKQIGQCKRCKGQTEENLKSLESCIETLEARNYNIELAKVELENKNILLETKFNQLTKEKKVIEDAQNIEIEENCKRIKELERELSKVVLCLKEQEERVKELNDGSSRAPMKDDVSEIVKKVMNITYRSLKQQLSGQGNGSGEALQDSLAQTLRSITSTFLSQLSDAGSSSSGESSSPRGPMVTKPVSKTSFLIREYLDTTSSTKAEIPEDSNTTGNSQSFFPTSSPLPIIPNKQVPPPHVNIPDNPESVSPTISGNLPSTEKTVHISSSTDLDSNANQPVVKVESDIDVSKSSSPTFVNFPNNEIDQTGAVSVVKPIIGPGISDQSSSDDCTYEENKEESLKNHSSDDKSVDNFNEITGSELIASLGHVESNNNNNQYNILESHNNLVPQVPNHVNTITSSIPENIKNETLPKILPPDFPTTIHVPSTVPFNSESLENLNTNTNFTNPSDSFTFVPVERPEPPPIINSNSPSPQSHSPIEGNSLSNEILDEERNKHHKVKKTRSDVWCSQPPPLFDDENEDDWLLN